MELRIETRAQEFQAAARRLGSDLPRYTRPAFGVGLNMIRREAVSNHRFTPRSGNADRSVQVDVAANGLSGRVFLDTGIANYSPHLHEGTGIYGARRQPIRPTKGQALRFRGPDGRYMFRRSVRGIQGDPFLHRAGERRRADFVTSMERGVVNAIRAAGL